VGEVKVKRLPEDFVVDELSPVEPREVGRFALYRLSKSSITTLDAVREIQRRLELPRRRIAWGGLKDKYACTSQFLSIESGPPRGFAQGRWKLEYLGRSHEAFGPQLISGNRFTLRLRSLTDSDIAHAERTLPIVSRDGVPNYFDDQRFGSRSVAGEFVAEPWLRGDFERALFLAFAEPYFGDSGAEKRQKGLLRAHWGDWATCRDKLERSHRRSIVTFLADRPGDWRGALARVDVDLRSLYLAAFQSHLWNQLLAAALRRDAIASASENLLLSTGTHPLPITLDDTQRTRWQSLSIPLPSARLHLEDIADEQLRELVESTLSGLGWKLSDLKLKHFRDSFFSKGTRSAFVVPQGLEWESGPDDLHEGRRLLRLKFELPRGSYATIVIKRITDQPA
jgi:tRNA pseudouridine13 synthase